jgi:signal transduction histidine kinase
MSRDLDPSRPRRISRTRIEGILTRSVCAFAFVLYAVSLPDVLLQIPVDEFGWDLLFIAAIPAAVIWTLSIRQPGFWMRVAAGTSAALIIASFFLWHVGFIGHGGKVDARPWSWGIASIGIALACIATDAWFSALYAALFSLLVLMVPLTTAGNMRGWNESWQDALLAAATAVVIISPITALRRAATASDDAAAAAIRETAAAERARALRVERTRLDGLTHDTVMATLTVAARAESTEMMAAAADAAADSLKQLESLHLKDEASYISTGELISTLKAATAGYPTLITIAGATADGPAALPLVPSRALIQATVEAVRNSSLHALRGASEVAVVFSKDPAAGAGQAVITITDDGPGFDTAKVSPQRLGIRVSIVQRMQDACGQASIISNPTAGTRVQLTWREEPEKHE